MSNAAIAGVNAWMAVCTVWMLLLAMQRRAIRNGINLRPAPQHLSPAGGWPSVHVIVPARDEENSIERCVTHILAQDYPTMRLIVIDDRSTDATAARVSSLARSDCRVKLRRVTSLPPNWLAKSNALWQGTRGLIGSDWFLFIDADVMLQPDAIRTAIFEAEQRKLDLLTLWPRNAAEGFWEHLIIPLCGGIIALWFGGASPTGSRPFANGQFLLVRQTLYERIGGHASVRNALIEDVAFAEQCAAAGASCGTFGGARLAAVRMYNGLSEICEGWARIYAGTLRSGIRVLTSVLWLLVGSLLPYLLMPLLIANACMSPTAENVALLSCCALHVLLIHIVSYGFWKMGECDRRYLWLYPLSVLVVSYILLRAGWILKIARTVRWRSVQYRIDGAGRIFSRHGPCMSPEDC